MEVAATNGFLGEGGQITVTRGREGKGENGRERTSAVCNGPDTLVWGSSNDEGQGVSCTHVHGPGACKENTYHRGKAGMAWRTAPSDTKEFTGHLRRTTQRRHNRLVLSNKCTECSKQSKEKNTCKRELLSYSVTVITKQTR